MQRRSGANGSDGGAHKRDPSEQDRNSQDGRRKRRRVAESSEPVATPEDHSVTAHATATTSISILSEPTSSPARVLKAILDIKEMTPSNRSLVISSGCIPHLLHRLAVGFDANDQHILHVVDALCKENSDIRHQFRTIAFIKKFVALAIPALGDGASSGSTARSARQILKELSDSSNSDYDKDVIKEQQHRLDSLKQDFFMTQTLPYTFQEQHADGECETCSVCLDKMNHDAATSSDSSSASAIACCLPCNHSFHKACISKWLPKHASCPVCRHKLQEPPRTPLILSSAVDIPFPFSLLFGLGLGAFGAAGLPGAFGAAGLPFGIPPQLMPGGGMNVVLISVRSGNTRRTMSQLFSSDESRL